MVQHDIGPQVHAFAVLEAELVEFLHEIEIDPAGTHTFSAAPATAFAEFPGLVAAGIEVEVAAWDMF